MDTIRSDVGLIKQRNIHHVGDVEDRGLKTGIFKHLNWARAEGVLGSGWHSGRSGGLLPLTP